MTKKTTIIGMIIVIFLGIGSFFVIPKKEIKLKELNEPDITFGYVIDGVKKDTAPKENEGYAFDDKNSSCINGTEIYWDTETWSAKIKNLKNTKTTCTLSFNKKYTEGILKGTDPILGNGMVPITIEDNGIVHKADISTEWYSYADKRWANAVILVDETKEYKNGEVIPESEIESYFVWIPRYKYQLKANEKDFNGYTAITDMGNVTDVNDFYSKEGVKNKGATEAFAIQFENKNEPLSTNTTINGWYTHPAFLSFDSNGFWVGKFETGYNQNDDSNNVATTNIWSTNGSGQNIIDSSKVIIKPNVYSWRDIQISNAFYTSYEYKRELESHMMKNMEWGAIAYLTQSNYGRCTNGVCTEVRINNADNYITGMSAKSEPTCGYNGSNENCNRYETINELGTDGTYTNNYNNPESVASSTTENYTGIYDLAGGAWDYVMGVMKASSNNANPTTGADASNNSGFNGPYSNDSTNVTKTDGLAWPSDKYYDLYDYSTSNQEYQRGKLGDGTKEFGPFYSVGYLGGTNKYVSSYNAGWAYFVNSKASWFAHGGSRRDGTDASIYAFSTDHGGKYTKYSFRIILSP